MERSLTDDEINALQEQVRTYVLFLFVACVVFVCCMCCMWVLLHVFL